ncbi:MAG: glycoside hydrolase family 3 protein, partial [Demequinaceae bacterium]|nr:glycoside hydrolase family 3 protein [Demequinaceae bacterium]
MNPLTVLMPGFVGTEAPEWLVERLEAGLGGVCLFAENVASVSQVTELTSALYEARANAIISMDEEGGDVSRLHQREGSPFPGNAVLGRLDDATLTRGVAELVGLELRRVGVGLALAPDADVNSNADNPVIGVRSFGSDPAAVALHTAAWTEGLQSTGVAACAKHFPGHGDTSQDSHVALPVVSADEATLRSRELVPFRAAIAAGTRTIMTSHIVVPALDPDHPATFSHRILTGLLREELGFEGVIVTDALDMVGASGERGIPAAAVAALVAGADLLCIGTRNTDAQIGEIAAAIDAAVADGLLPAERLADAI